MNAPLTGVRVVDLTTTFMGPYVTMLMARMGADVIKVESPDGDVLRQVGAGRSPGMGPIFLAANHGKRSVALDLASPGGRDAMRALLVGADAFVTNMRPDAVDRLGLGPDELCAADPRLVYVALRGFGGGGPYRGRAAYDDVIQAASGLAAVQGGEGEPAYVRSVVADKTVALMGLSAVNAALFARERTGRGGFTEVPMFETMASFLLVEQQNANVLDPLAPTGYARTETPYRRPYRTSDGYLGVVVYTDRQWRSPGGGRDVRDGRAPVGGRADPPAPADVVRRDLRPAGPRSSAARRARCRGAAGGRRPGRRDRPAARAGRARRVTVPSTCPDGCPERSPTTASSHVSAVAVGWFRAPYTRSGDRAGTAGRLVGAETR